MLGFTEYDLLEEEVQEGGDARGVPPVPLEIGGDGELGQDVDTSIPHAIIGEVSGTGFDSAGSIGIGEDGIPGLK